MKVMMGNKIDNLIGKGRKIAILWAFNRRNPPFSHVFPTTYSLSDKSFQWGIRINP